MTGADFTQLPLTQDDAPGEARSTPVTCLGLTFADDTERRAHYRERLAEKLRDPAFRAIEGFPIAEDEAILALSDPPYHTACPNPFLPEIMAAWQAQRRAIREQLGLPDDAAPDNGGNGYHCEPFAADVSEGKGDPIYNAHSYHTKVPHKAIMRYILHYTAPGDIVLDGFCGTGMTGVAAQLCGDRRAVMELGYRVDGDGVIFEGSKPISRLGARKAALADLSPIATFIGYNYNTPADAAAFEREATRILTEVRDEIGWMYETVHEPRAQGPTLRDDDRSLAPRGRDEPRAQGPILRDDDRSLAPRGRGDVQPQNAPVMGRINYTVWSEVFLCPQCSGEIGFLDEALDEDTQRVKESFACPHCAAQVTKRSLEKCRTTILDPVLGRTVETLKRKPVLIEYTVGSGKYTKNVDAHDLDVLDRIERLPMPASVPANALPIAQMYHGSRLAPKGVTHIHQLFHPRARHALHALWTKAQVVPDPRLRAMLLFAFEQAIWGMSLLNRYQPIQYGRVGGSQVNRFLSGVYYISSLISEVSPWYILDGKTDRIAKAFGGQKHHFGGAAIATQSTTAAALPDNSIDYIFTDPPFGENIYYADLNYLLESWHGVRTNSGPEAIIDQAKRKTLADYQELMRACFRRYYAALKPGRWMTVEFHNSHNAVWRAVQEALMSAGFVVADTRTLDKQQASYRQVTAASAAKQDLVISAYKPASGFEQRFLSHAGTEDAAWDFVRQHLAHVPAVVWGKNDRLETVAERQNYLLFDRMVAYHIQHGVAVPLGAAAFYAGLRDRFAERDGMHFLPEQTAEYDRARLRAAGMAQLAMFVSDEKSAVAWLRAQFLDQPATFQEIQPRFLQELHQARHEALPDLRVLLEENFLQDEAGRWYVPDPNKAEDLEKLRLRGLLREFQGYMEGRGRLRQFRTEAVRAGFAQAWRARDYATIVKVAERLPEDVLQEDPDLLMYTDNASLRVN